MMTDLEKSVTAAILKQVYQPQPRPSPTSNLPSLARPATAATSRPVTPAPAVSTPVSTPRSTQASTSLGFTTPQASSSLHATPLSETEITGLPADYDPQIVSHIS